MIRVLALLLGFSPNSFLKRIDAQLVLRLAEMTGTVAAAVAGRP